jgi:hypothetical protein
VTKTVKLTIAFTLLTLITLGLSGCGGGSEGAKDGGVAATVNGKTITVAEVERRVSQQVNGQEAKLSQQQFATAKLTVLDSLIQEEVLYQRAEKEKLLPTEDEISQTITTQKAGMTEEEFQRKLKEQKLTPEAFRDETRRLLAVQKLQAKYTGDVKISDHEVEEYYAANKQQFIVGRGLDLAEIMVDPRDNGLQDDAKNEADAKTKIDAAYAKLKEIGTERFGELALAKSEDGNTQGGDIGFKTQDELKRAGMPEALITQLFSMQPGEYTQPVQFFNGGWYIFKLKRKQLETENRTLESQGVRPQITEALRNQRQELLNSILFKITLYDAKIVNNLANEMLINPNNLGLRPAAPGSAPTTAASQAPPAASPAASAAASPTAAAQKPASTTASPAGSPKK